MNEFVVTLDPGKRKDPAAVMVTRDRPIIVDGNAKLESPDRITHSLEIVMAEQYRDWPYDQLVGRLADIMGHRELKGNADLLVDSTGVGEAVIDIMRSNHLMPVPILTTGGSQDRYVYAPIGQVFGSEPGQLRGARTLLEIHVPKENLVQAGAVVMEQSRVQVARGLKDADVIRRQLEHFTGELNEKTKKRTYNTDDDEIHDDYVTCYLLAAWWFTKGKKDTILEPVNEHGKDGSSWNPYDHL